MQRTAKQKAKRRDIAQKTIPLFLKQGIRETTISQIAEHAGIGKGTIYHYFDSREDIIFEIYDAFNEDFYRYVEARLSTTTTVKEKLAVALGYLTDQPDEFKAIMPIFNEYFAICLGNPTEKMQEYNQGMFQGYVAFLSGLFEEGIASGEIKNKNALHAVTTICAAIDGFFLYTEVLKDFDMKKEGPNFLQFIYDYLGIE